MQHKIHRALKISMYGLFAAFAFVAAFVVGGNRHPGVATRGADIGLPFLVPDASADALPSEGDGGAGSAGSDAGCGSSEGGSAGEGAGDGGAGDGGGGGGGSSSG